ncbi:tail fiber domain-containing protein [Oceanihabitans sp.]|nr:tail fiber domain-containing protein [Oceanihabitans sp.]
MAKITKFLQAQILFFLLLISCIASAQVGIGTTAPTAQLTVMEDGIFNESGGNNNFRVESDTEGHMFFINGTDNQMFVRSAVQHLGYIDPFNVYANALGTATVGIQFAISGWNQGNLGGGGNFVIEDINNGYAAMEAATMGAGSAVRGLSTNNSDAYGVYGSIPPGGIGSWLGFGGLFTGGLGYANGVYNLSDMHAKRDIAPINAALDKVLNIQGVSYKYDLTKYNKDGFEDPSTYYGFIAQNVKEFLPHAVKQKNIPFENSKNRIPLNESKLQLLNVVDYTSIIPVTVEAIKEQQEIIDSQNIRILNLEDKIALLENKLNTLIENQD